MTDLQAAPARPVQAQPVQAQPVQNQAAQAQLGALRMLDPAGAAAALAEAGVVARGFLGTDPVTQNGALLAAELTRMGATVCQAGDALVGYAHRPGQPRQALVASTSAEPGPVAALLGFLRTYHRSTSCLALVPDGSPAAAAFAGCGFRRAGVLREHRYGAGEYHDVLVYVAKMAETAEAGTCRS
jgi:hypothetical protein